MEEMLIKFLVEYGWQLTLMACSGIFFLGILRVLHVFDGIEEDKRKYVFAPIATIISIISSGLYLYITGEFEFSGLFIISAPIYLLNQAIYSVYENIGIRALLRKIGCAIKKGLKILGYKFVLVVAKGQVEEEKQKLLEEEVKKEEISENETPKEI